MSALVLGEQMVRLEDGQKGVVALIEGERRIVFDDRGEQRFAQKKEVWEVAARPRLPLRAEEKLEIALWADKALHSLEQHEPMHVWQRPLLSAEPYDNGLVMAILAYLSSR